ncbi:MAG TPA: fumarylacetoacetate hydrolase family protein [Ignavibacteriaceae bacterium]|nr:fumarylacetoacetate hydrolase family protein [Ignavibacteriaceae bacterium]
MKSIKIKNSSKEIPIGKIVCVGRNYAEHARELGNEVPEKPVVFLKPASAAIRTGGKIIYPSFSNEMHHEVELVLLIGAEIKNSALFESENAIIGYGLGLDMTLRDVQNELKKKAHPWTIAKCFDTSAVLSDFTLKENYLLNLEEEIFLSVNGVLRQKDKLNKMLFKPAQIVQYISTLMTLEEGDLIFTGTPAGVGKVESGDNITAKILPFAELTAEVI